MGISLFNTPKPRKFELPPRYYDEEKTEHERRLRKWEQLQKDEKPGYNREDFKSELKMRWSNARESEKGFNKTYTNRKRMMVLFVIVIIIVAIMYFISKKYFV